MPLSVRVQGPGAPVTLSLDDGATIDDLRSRIAAELGMPAGSQEIRSGFPPTILASAGDALVSAELGSQARILVKTSSGAETSGGGTSAGGGTAKGQAQE